MNKNRPPALSTAGNPVRTLLCNIRHAPDLWAFTTLLVAANLPLAVGGFNSAWTFLPDAARSGQWWRIATHPFVHVSPYHLLLDAGAFLLLYTGLRERRITFRLVCVAVCGLSSLIFGLAFSPMIDTMGLCGLSGIAHGLMALSALESMAHEQDRLPGIVSFGIVSAKSLYELATGQVLFEFLQLGLCGTPMAACHAGGVAGGILAAVITRHLRAARKIQKGWRFA